MVARVQNHDWWFAGARSAEPSLVLGESPGPCFTTVCYKDTFIRAVMKSCYNSVVYQTTKNPA